MEIKIIFCINCSDEDTDVLNVHIRRRWKIDLDVLNYIYENLFSDMFSKALLEDISARSALANRFLNNL